MPFVNNKPGTSQLPPLPASNQPKQAPAAATGQTATKSQVQTQVQTQVKPPAPPAAQATAQPQLPGAVQPKDKSQVSSLGGALGSINLIDTTPFPPALIKKGDANLLSLELNSLLFKLGTKVPLSNIFSDKTEAAIKDFQKSNGLRETGEVDELTLRKLFDASKEEDENFPKLLVLLNSSEADGEVPDSDEAGGPTGPLIFDPNKKYANDFERVKDMVACQIDCQGKDPEAAFAVGAKLTASARKWDKLMGSSTMCYTAVKRAIDDALDIPYKVFKGKGYVNGGSAKTAGQYLLSKSPEFVKIDGLKREDLDNLPAGAVIVYKPSKGHGHIGVQDGAGHDISDKSREQRNVHRNAKFEVWYPTKVRGAAEPVAPAAPKPAPEAPAPKP